MNFIEKGWFHPPQYYRQLKKIEREKTEKAEMEEKAAVVDKFQIDPKKFAEIEKSAKPAK
jgi:hypothetical protein